MGVHAKFAPSSAPIWGPDACPASVRMQEAYPDREDSDASREGTTAHYYVTETLAGRPPAVGVSVPGTGFAIDAEMVECGQDMIRDVRDTLAAAGPDATLHIEQRVGVLGHFHRDNSGTPDVYIVNFKTRRLYIWDYKYGRRYVDAFQNWQTINYVILILTDLLVPPSEWQEWFIDVTICQPRNFHPEGPIRHWPFSGVQLVGYGNRLLDAIKLAENPNAPMVTGSHCRDCSARHACPALQRAAMSAVDVAYSGLPLDMPPDALGLELTILRAAIKRMGDRATGLEEQALHIIKTGGSVAGWTTERTKGRKRWKVDASEVAALGQIFGVDLMKPPTPITPTQAIKAGVDQSVIEAYSEQPYGAMGLFPVTDHAVAKRFS
jgi:hypothetical protein